MAPLADFLLAHVPLPPIPRYLSSYIPGETPLSTTSAVVTTLLSYLAIVFGVQAVMQNKRPRKLTLLFQAHNLFLSSGSLLLLVLMLEETLPRIWYNGIYHAMCHQEAWTARMEFYYMINYYFKYLELVDTVFLAFKKKPLGVLFEPASLYNPDLMMTAAFLHVFHHSATALLCYGQLNGRTSISWVVISLNLAVHVLMYYYYYATAGGAKIWWKEYLTMMQITQFVIDLSVVYVGTYMHFAATYYDGILPHLGNCSGSERAAIFGCSLLTSYLGLFINFYLQTYKKPVKGRKPEANGNGALNGNGHKSD